MNDEDITIKNVDKYIIKAFKKYDSKGLFVDTLFWGHIVRLKTEQERARIVGIIKKRINCEIKNSPCFVCEELKDLRYEIESKK